MRNTILSKLVMLAFISLLPLVGFAQRAGDLDRSFNNGSGANNPVLSVVFQPDGKMLIGGSFTSYNGNSRNRIARINSDGSIDNSFFIGTGIDSVEGYPYVRKVVTQPDGKIIVAGDFTSFNGIQRRDILRLNLDGSLDTSFRPGTGNDGNGGIWIEDLALQQDGKILLCGSISSFNGMPRNGVVRLNIDGSLDDEFYPLASEGSSFITAIQIQPDMKILLGGNLRLLNNPNANLIRLNNDGSLDTNFHLGISSLIPNGTIGKISIQQDGKIVIGGGFTGFNGSTSRIARLLNNGYLDSTFTSGFPNNFGFVRDIVIQTNGKMLLSGDFNNYQNRTIGNVLRINENGGLDTSLNTRTGLGPVIALAVQNDGKIILVGSFLNYDAMPSRNLARIHSRNCETIELPIISGNLSFCSSNSMLLTSSATIGNLWSTGDTSRSITISQAGNYTVRLISGACTSAVSDTFRVTVNQPSTLTTVQSICQGSPYQFGGLSRTTSGVYYDTLTNTVGCDSIVILNLTVRPTSLTIISQSICQGSAYQFGGLSRTTSGVYYDTLTNTVGCDSVITLNLTVRPTSSTLISQLICQGESYLFGGLTRTISGIYYDTLSNVVGCDSIITLTLNVNSIPDAPTISGNRNFCTGGFTTLTSNTPIGNLWNTGDTTQSIIVNIAGSYSVSVVSNSCTSGVSDSFHVNENERPVISGNPFFCENGSTVLSSSYLYGNIWSTGDTTQSITVSNSGSYYLTRRFEQCSLTSDTIQVQAVTFPSNPFLSLSTYPLDTLICMGDPNLRFVTAPEGYDYIWNNGPIENQNYQQITYQSFQYDEFLNSTPRSYDVRLVKNGCTSQVSNTIIFRPFDRTFGIDRENISSECELPIARLRAVIFNGSPISFNYRFVWNTGDTAESIIVNGPGQYTFRAIGGPCDGYRTWDGLIDIEPPTLLTLPTPNISVVGRQFLCNSNPVILSAEPGYSYRWNTGDTTQIIQVTSPGNYNVRYRYIGTDRCSSELSNTINVNNYDSHLTAPIERTICPNNIYRFNGIDLNQSGTYSDTLRSSEGCDSIITLGLTVRPVSSTSLAQTICQGNSYQFGGLSRTQSGVYYDTLTNSFGCDSIIALNLTVISPSTPSISGNTAFCQGGFSRLTSSSPTGNLWNTGDTTRFINVAQAGSYSVRVISGNCTSAVSSLFNVINQGPASTVINFDTTSNRCLGARIQLTPAGTFTHYYWNTGERTRSIYTRLSGQYSVQVANSDSCFGLPSPPIFIAFDTNWCSVEIYRMGVDSITANVWADYYIWYLDGIELLTSNTLKTIPIQGDGVYTFRAVTAGRTSPLSNPIVITSSKKSLAKTKLEIYPNPASDKVTIKTTGTGSLEILNTLGQVVVSQPATETNEINISKLAKGVYTVRFNGNSQKLIVR